LIGFPKKLTSSLNQFALSMNKFVAMFLKTLKSLL